ncbi:MAG TPA: hypothetical protein VMU66_00385 [Gaiellales bacterium]|nr:hypothetical protein [Gaiellales bacterium]
MLFGLFFPMLYASVPVLAFVRYDRNPQVAGCCSPRWVAARWPARSWRCG